MPLILNEKKTEKEKQEEVEWLEEMLGIKLEPADLLPLPEEKVEDKIYSSLRSEKP